MKTPFQVLYTSSESNHIDNISAGSYQIGKTATQSKGIRKYD